MMIRVVVDIVKGLYTRTAGLSVTYAGSIVETGQLSGQRVGRQPLVTSDIGPNSMDRVGQSDLFRLGAAMVAVAVVTLTLAQLLRISNAATVSTTYLMVVLVVAATSRLRVAVATPSRRCYV